MDLNGLWRVDVFVIETAVSFSDICSIIITQDGPMVLLSGSCQATVSPVTIRGTIDPATRSFTGSGTAGTCGEVMITGTVAADYSSFTGTFDCRSLSMTGTVNADRCGNGQLDPGETCDDGNRFNGDCCSARCFVLQEGSRCSDDGNPCTTDTCNATGQCQHASRTGACSDLDPCTVGDACVNGHCIGSAQPENAECSDGNACTTGDVCVHGVCTGQPVVCSACLSCVGDLGCVPAISRSCKQASAHSLVLRRRGMDTVSWRLDRGDATGAAELGDPTATTGYEFCIYDSSYDAGGAPRLVIGARAPTGDAWRATSHGFWYYSQDLTPDGLRTVSLRTAAAGRAGVRVKGQGVNIALPALQSLVMPITVQLKSSDGSATPCWSAQYDRPALANRIAVRADLTVRQPDTRPNILVIGLDDTRADGIDRMHTLLSGIAGQGVSFSNSFVVNPLCAPSRASLLTGRHSSGTGVRALNGVIGGHARFRDSGADRQTIAVWLQAAGYTTGLFGKYINGYGLGADQRGGPGGAYYVPPGWTRWRAMTSPEHYGGLYGTTYTLIDERGVAVTYGEHSNDDEYSTDLLGQEVRRFIRDAVAQRRPFFAVFTPYASHADTPAFVPQPAARHAGWFRDLPVWRPPSYNEPDASDKPPWIRDAQPGLASIILTDEIRTQAYATLLAVDDQLRTILDYLVELGIDDDTVILITSDNGVGWGEHRIFNQGKACVYEECLRVPLIVRDPRRGRTPIVRDAAVLNIDVAPTVAALAGVVPPVATDGTSVAFLLSDRPSGPRRDDFLIEYWRADRGTMIDYRGQPTDGDQLRILYGDTRQHPRPSVLFEFDDGSGVANGAVPVPIGADDDATFAAFAGVVTSAVPSTRSVHNRDRNRVGFIDESLEQHGILLLAERNQGGALVASAGQGDWVGVRDASGALTYVEHESGEVELYDLRLDPMQLENKASDQSYAPSRARLAARLDELLR